MKFLLKRAKVSHNSLSSVAKEGVFLAYHQYFCQNPPKFTTAVTTLADTYIEIRVLLGFLWYLQDCVDFVENALFKNSGDIC